MRRVRLLIELEATIEDQPFDAVESIHKTNCFGLSHINVIQYKFLGDVKEEKT